MFSGCLVSSNCPEGTVRYLKVSQLGHQVCAVQYYGKSQLSLCCLSVERKVQSRRFPLIDRGHSRMEIQNMDVRYLLCTSTRTEYGDSGTIFGNMPVAGD